MFELPAAALTAEKSSPRKADVGALKMNGREIKEKRFDKAAMFGYKAEEVDLYLAEVAQAFDSLVKEKAVLEKKITILLSSHIFSEVDATCDRIAIIKDGRLVSVFEADELKHSAQKVYEVYFSDLQNYDAFRFRYKNSKLLRVIAEDRTSASVLLSTDW